MKSRREWKKNRMEKAEKKKGEKEIKLFSTRENKSYFEKESQKSRNNLIFVSKGPILAGEVFDEEKI